MKRTTGFFFILVSLFILIGILHFVTEPGYEVFNVIKPVTLMQYTGFLMFAFFLEYFKDYFNKYISVKVIDYLIIIGFFVMMTVSFEMLWAFFYWFSAFVKSAPLNTAALDLLTYVPRNTALYPDMSLNFAAKKNVMFLFMSIYFVYFLKVRRDENTKKIRKI